MKSGKYTHWIGVSLLSLTVTLSALGAYHFFFIADTQYAEKLFSKAKTVAEKEITFSGRYAQRLRTAEATNFINAAAVASKAVVSIRITVEQSESEENTSPLHGSGVIISSDGSIVTNYHVVQNADKINVTLADNRQLAAELMGFDAYSDLALLQVEATDLPYLLFGNSDSLTVGEWVLAVGNPFRLQSTVTAGIVSAKARQLQLYDREGIESFIQTDAAINPGNSGGALVNTAGELVGISTAVVSESGRYEGFSFAIPSNITRKVISDIHEYGSVQRAWLGVECTDVNQAVADELGINEVTGVTIQSVQKEGAAADAGLRKKDIIKYIDNTNIHNYAHFIGILAVKRPGDKVKIRFVRDRQEMTREVVLTNQSNTYERLTVLSLGILQKLGLEIRDANSREKMLVPGTGAVVLSVKRTSVANVAHIEPGFLITRCNGVPVYSALQLVEKLEENRGKPIRIEGYYPGIPGKYPYEFAVPE